MSQRPEPNTPKFIEVHYSTSTDLAELVRQCELNLRRQRVDHLEDRHHTSQGNPVPGVD